VNRPAAFAKELGVDIDEHIEFCIAVMQARAEEAGLAGNEQAAP